jgi:transposase
MPERPTLADLLVRSPERYDVELLGPTRLDAHGHAREGAGFEAPHFQRDGDRQHAICPAGKTRISWTPAVDRRGHAGIQVKVSTKAGRPWPT